MSGFRILPSISGLVDLTRTRVVLSQSGRDVGAPFAEFASLIAQTFAFQAFTAAEIADGNHAVNTENKVAGRVVWDTTNNRVMVASDTNQIAPWYTADGSISITPE